MTSMIAVDRTVHAESGNLEVVRYDRAGKWFCESKKNAPRVPLTLAEAVSIAYSFTFVPGGKVYQRPGGMAFWSQLRKRMAQTSHRDEGSIA